MNRLILAAALAAGCTLASSAPALAAAKNYDCTKAANANKAACKGAARPATARAAQKAPPAKAAATTTKAGRARSRWLTGTGRHFRSSTHTFVMLPRLCKECALGCASCTPASLTPRR